MSLPVIDQILVRHVRVPLNRPYWSMISTLHALDTLVVEVLLDNGSTGYGEAAIVNGYTHETQEGGWRFCVAQGRQLVGLSAVTAMTRLAAHRADQAHGVTGMMSALEMALRHPLLEPISDERRLPVVGAIQTYEADDIRREAEGLLRAGFRTLKVKVGQDVQADLARIRFLCDVVAGAATLRLDANQGFSQDDACAFAAQLPSVGVELFEQGSRAGDWRAALAIRAASTVPTMLDESIFDLSDIERAAGLNAAQLIKLKLAKCGGVDLLTQSLERIRHLGMESVLGNGVASEISNWMEACVAHRHVQRTGEMNGFTRLATPLFATPLRVDQGCLVLPANFQPEIDLDALSAHTVRAETFRDSTRWLS